MCALSAVYFSLLVVFVGVITVGSDEVVGFDEVVGSDEVARGGGGAPSTGGAGPGADDQVPHHREKRQWMAREACMMTFTVPKQSITCDPSPEFASELAQLRKALGNQEQKLGNLTNTVAALDPDRPRELPQEVRERLDTILAVQIEQAGYQENLRRVDTNIQHLEEKVERVEASDRQELARLIDLQSSLIKVALHQSNVSLHDEYVDRLTESTSDLQNKLTQLELELRNSIRDSEGKLESTVQRSDIATQSEVSRVRERVERLLTSFEKKLLNESETRLHYQNRTDANKGDLVKLLLTLKSLGERQTVFQENEESMRTKLDNLDRDLQQEKEEKQAMARKTELLQKSLTKMEAFYKDLLSELRECTNRTNTLKEKYETLETEVRERDHLIPKTLKVADCQDALRFFQPASGVYSINPGLASRPVDVYCEVQGQTGWTVLLRRQDGSENFYRDWTSYKKGFGNLEREHWIGLETIYTMTNQKKYRLHVDIQDWTGKWWYAEYNQFYLESEANNYKIHVSGYSGDAGDSFKYHDGMEFSTHDRNHDLNEGICARWCHGAWWYRDCFSSNLNGRYYETGGEYRTKTGWGDGVVWRELKQTNYYSVKSAIMKVAPLTTE